MPGPCPRPQRRVNGNRVAGGRHVGLEADIRLIDVACPYMFQRLGDSRHVHRPVDQRTRRARPTGVWWGEDGGCGHIHRWGIEQTEPQQRLILAPCKRQQPMLQPKTELIAHIAGSPPPRGRIFTKAIEGGRHLSRRSDLEPLDRIHMERRPATLSLVIEQHEWPAGTAECEQVWRRGKHCQAMERCRGNVERSTAK